MRNICIKLVALANLKLLESDAHTPNSEQLPLRGRGLQDSPLMEGLRGPSVGISRDGRPPPGLVEPSSSKACFSQRYAKHKVCYPHRPKCKIVINY